MQVNTDGSVTFTKEAFEELKKAYNGLYTTLTDAPTFLGDYFEDRGDYLNTVKWGELLDGGEFNREDWE